MNIKQIWVLAATALLLGAAGPAAAASSPPADASAKNVLPVFVEVDDQGAITHIDPAFTIQPQYDRVLRQTLDKMITKPARDKDGKTMSSQFVINLDMQTTPRQDGQYELKFVYVSITKVPPGNWHWMRTDHGRTTALVSQSGSSLQSYQRSQMRRYRKANSHIRAATPPSSGAQAGSGSGK